MICTKLKEQCKVSLFNQKKVVITFSYVGQSVTHVYCGVLVLCGNFPTLEFVQKGVGVIVQK